MKEKYLDVFEKHGFHFGRCFGSKTSYHTSYPENLVIFNSRIYLKDIYNKNVKDIKDFLKGQDIEIWYGDLDFNKDIYKLFRVSLEIKKPLVITTEHGHKIIEIGE